jgi:hypothetical protein
MLQGEMLPLLSGGSLHLETDSKGHFAVMNISPWYLLLK